jgi:putative hydrolase of the HAD superfamily
MSPFDVSVGRAPIRWDEIDTVLLDMDGTLLDLAFDNFFWLEVVPAEYALRHGIDEAEAARRVLSGYERVVGTLEWYCVEHWSRELSLDIPALKARHRHRIGYLPGARRFLSALRSAGKGVRLVTNAHPRALAIKVAETGLDLQVDAMVSSHEIGAPKERREFWTALAARQPFDAERTLLVEDSLAVLRTAKEYGVRHVLAIRRPDSRQPPREVAGFPAVDGVADLLGDADAADSPGESSGAADSSSWRG